MARKSRRGRPRSNITYLSPQGRIGSSGNGDDDTLRRGPGRKAPPSATGAIYFERGSAIPRREDIKVLRRHARRLREHPRAVLLIRGFSNRRRASDSATRLAKSRAAVVRMLLVALGAKEAQLDTSIGGVYRVTAGTTRVSRARNRRVTLRGAYTEIGVALSRERPGSLRDLRGRRRVA